MDFAKFFVVRFAYKRNSCDITIVRTFSLWNDAVYFCNRLNYRFSKYTYRVLTINQLNEFGILPF